MGRRQDAPGRPRENFRAWTLAGPVLNILHTMQATTSDSKASGAPIAILGVPFDGVNLDETLALAGEMIATRRPHYVTTVGVDFLAEALEDVELRRILFDAHLVVAEDKTVVWASKMLGNPLPASVAIPGFIPRDRKSVV